jgi:hypothetical protein
MKDVEDEIWRISLETALRPAVAASSYCKSAFLLMLMFSPASSIAIKSHCFQQSCSLEKSLHSCPLE